LFQTAGFVALAAVLGCSGSGNLATVSGVVRHNGNPVEGAKVTFHSTAEVEGKAGLSFSALTDSSGKYVIATGVGKAPGIPPGLYKVTITKMKGGSGAMEGLDQGQLEAAGAGGGSVQNALPMEYATLNTSKLSVTVEVGKNPNKDFDLKGEVRPTRATSVP
jgi:hypothetical protein